MKKYNKPIESNKIYLLIPLSGCTPCSLSALDFMKKQISNQRFRFIITGIVSRKSLEVKLGEEGILSNQNILTDTSGFFTELLSPYPILFYTDSMSQLSYQITIHPEKKDSIFNSLY